MILLTGLALAIHAMYYSAISAMALSDRVLASMTGDRIAFVILGRVLFAVVAVAVGWVVAKGRTVLLRDAA